MVKVVKVPMVSMAMMVKRNKMVQVPNILSRPSWALAHDVKRVNVVNIVKVINLVRVVNIVKVVKVVIVL